MENFKNKKVVFLGDSITAGACATTAENRYTNVFAALSGADVFAYGICGTRIARQIKPSYNSEFDRYFASRIDDMVPAADYVFVFGGTNDFGHGDAPLGRFGDTSPETFYGAVYDLLYKLKNKYPNGEIVLITPLHRLSENDAVNEWGYPVKKTLAEVVAAEKETAKKFSVSVIDLYGERDLYREKDENGNAFFVADGLHPNDEGHRLIAEIIYRFLKGSNKGGNMEVSEDLGKTLSEVKAIVDFGKSAGRVKPMHGVNNGPIKPRTTDQNLTNFASFKAAGFPFARTHDSAHYGRYGLNHTVDVMNIFTDLDKDPYDENNYDFACTDEYIGVIIESGADVFYRLGTSIEHYVKKYNCKPPKDFKKYAVVCEHIIRHYNEGWANGFHYNIRFWEIWNEPDTHTDGLAHADDPSWTGTPEQFYVFFNTVHSHLKTCFPDLMIGGPALGFPKDKWMDDFLLSLKGRSLDFLSWHRYFKDVYKTVEYANVVREKLDKYGFRDTLSILGEWNYVRGWSGEEFKYSIKAIKSIKGASFVQAAMSISQYTSIDMLLYYDARPSSYNGIFGTDVPSDILKGYYPFYNFNKLYKIGESVFVSSDDKDIVVSGAYKGGKGGLLITHYDEDDLTPPKDISITLKFPEDGKYKLTYYLTDAEKDNAIVKEELVSGKKASLNLFVRLFDCYYVEIIKICG